MQPVNQATEMARGDALEKGIASAAAAMCDLQRDDGHWVFELEADDTIPSEYILLRHHLGEPVDATLEAKIAKYIRRRQGTHGGWALVQDGPFDMSASVKAYFALKMIGDSVDAAHMVRARQAILSRGGAINSNVFTRFTLAMYGVLTWKSVPLLPVEIMLLPMWSPFHLTRTSYGRRTTLGRWWWWAGWRPGGGISRGAGLADCSSRIRSRSDSPPRRRTRAGAGFCCFGRSTNCCAWSSLSSRRNCASARSTPRLRSPRSG